ncbi:MAG: hypothetical protein DHS20C21_13050 [Gemmatimonadota bacterium]|nr:MAG: hypothetical protein DHS20C21_13050 [Gemmatimonadota bacterium]
MKTHLMAAIGFAVVLGVAGAASAQHEGHNHADHAGKPHPKAADKAKDAAPAFSEEDMAKWMKTMSPGKAHKALEFFAGDWTFVNKSFMSGTETDEEGTTHAAMMMGGRYLHSSHKSQSMGMPFEGAGITGYDNMAGEYFNLWLDNFGTGVIVSRGSADEKGNITTKGTMPDPMSGDMIGFRMVTMVTGPNSYTFEMYMDSPEGEQRVMEIKYARVTG